MEIASPTDNFLLGEIRNKPSFKGVYSQSILRALYFNLISPKESRFLFCKEFLLTIPVVVYTRKNFYLLDAINRKIQMVVSAGLVRYWDFENVDRNYLNSHDINHPRTMTVTQLFGCFQILIIGCALSFLVFYFELIAAKFFLLET